MIEWWSNSGYNSSSVLLYKQPYLLISYYILINKYIYKVKILNFKT